MKSNLKHPARILLVVALAFVMVLMIAACTPKPGPDDGSDKGDTLEPLAALADYKNAQPSDLTYGDTDVQEIALETKRGSYRAKLTDEANFVWQKDAEGNEPSTFAKIFAFATPADIIERFRQAGLEENKMQKLVAYITRGEAPAYNLSIGQGDAFQDYDELDRLYDLYDEDSKKIVAGTSYTSYELLNLKQHKAMGELVQIFGASGDQAARTAIEIIAYAQEVVVGKIAPDETTADCDKYTGYGAEKVRGKADEERLIAVMKEVLFDYDSLSYMLAYNESLAGFNFDTFKGVDYAKLMTLYGYYYLYEKVDYEFWSGAQFTYEDYKKYLKLSQKDYFSTEAEALEYTNYDRKHYAKVYRYTDQFYELYYKAHFNFQGLVETHEKAVYTNKAGQKLPDAVATLTSGNTYAAQMQEGLAYKRLSATLTVSDVNYEYTGVDQNIKNYQKVSKAYYELPKATREIIESDSYSGSHTVNEIKYVELQVEQLKSQKYTIDHKDVIPSNRQVMTKVLEYQIYSYRADYIRGIQSYRKENVIFEQEVLREQYGANDAAVIAKKEDQYGRNNAMITHMVKNLNDAATQTQLDLVPTTKWDKVSEEMGTTINQNYRTYHQTYVNGKPRYEVQNEIQVKDYFQDTLIKRTWQYKGDQDPAPAVKSELTGWVREYDTSHNISILANRHETVLRHANGQVKISYYNAANALKAYTVDKTVEGNTKFDTSASNKNFTIDLSGGATNIQYKYIESYPAVFSGDLTDAQRSPSNGTITGLYSTMVANETIATDTVPALAFWSNSGKNWYTASTYTSADRKTSDVALKDKTTSYFNLEKKEGNITYYYYFEFAGWYLDPHHQYLALPDETYSYDIRLYPGFYITVTTTPL